MKITQREKIMHLLSDGRYHCVQELQQICWRYSARLHEIREQNEMEKTPCSCKNGNPKFDHWRLVLGPQRGLF